MSDFMPLHTLVLALSAVIFLMIVLALVHVMNSTENDLDWSDLISAKGTDGKQHADWNRIGQGLGVVQCVWLPTVYAYSSKMDAGGLALLMGVSLAYLGAVTSYAATLRARRDATPQPGAPA